jgi:hypothetical protein
MSDPIIEAAARALLVNVTEEYSGSDLAAVIAVLSSIEDAALERAAKVAEDTARAQDGDNDYYAGARRGCFMAADAIRALKEQP